MRLIFITILFSLLPWDNAFAQSEFDVINWNKLVAFRVFTEYPKGRPIQELSQIELDSLSSINKDLRTSKDVLKKATPTGRNTAMFSGMQFGLATFFDGTARLFKISGLGFQDQTDGQYYDYFDDKLRADWNDFIYEERNPNKK